MALEDLVAAYGDRYDQLRLGTGSAVEQLWLEVGGPDDLRADRFAELATAVVEDAAAETGIVVEAYIDEVAGTVSGRPPRSADPLDLAELTIEQLRGVNPLDAWRRPAITARAGLAAGKPFEEAMAEAANRANAQAQADIALAHREAARRTMENTPGVDGYRRVLTGVSCSLCRIASTQRYRTADLMPIHPRCDCRVLPIVDGYDGGRIINRDLYRELKSSGELDRLNRRNRSTTGRSRAEAAARRRELASRQASIDGTQTALDLDAPPQAPAVRQHGELGPVLVDERHAFTAARRSVDEVTDAGDLTRRQPVDPPTDSVDDVPRPPSSPTDAAGLAPRFDPANFNVARAAARRNISPEQMAAELEAKRARRILDQRAERAAARELTASSPEVIEVARRNGVTPDEVLTARAEVADVRRVIADEAARAQAESFAQLERAEAMTLRRPPRGSKPAEYDWLEALDPAERARLSRRWWNDDVRDSIDDAAARAVNAGAIPASVNPDDDFVRWWLFHSRRYEAAGAIRRGKAPSSRAYSGAMDVDDVVAIDTYRASAIVGVDDLEAAGYIASRNRELLSDEALDYLGAAADPRHGSAPYRMSFQTWEAEVRELEYGLRNYPGEMPAESWDRLAELVPEYLDEPGTSFEELYARIVHTARLAGEDVPRNAVIPWADDVAPSGPSIDQLVAAAEEAGL